MSRGKASGPHLIARCGPRDVSGSGYFFLDFLDFLSFFFLSFFFAME